MLNFRYMKKVFALFFALFLLFLIPTPVYADISCSGNGTITSDGTSLTIVIDNTKGGRSDTYELIYLEGKNTKIGDCNRSGSSVTCTVPVDTFNSTPWATGPNKISVRLINSSTFWSDDCNFDLQKSDVAAVISTAPPPTTTPIPPDATTAAGYDTCTKPSECPTGSTCVDVPNLTDKFCQNTSGHFITILSSSKSATGLSGSECGIGVTTSLGGIPTDPVCLTRWVLKNGIVLGGSIAFLLSVWGGATILLSSGNPEKINEGKQIIGSAVAGLALIILSLFLLRLLGYDILKLPGFSL